MGILDGATEASSPEYSMGLGYAAGLSSDDGPGPGTYDVPPGGQMQVSRSSGPSYTMGAAAPSQLVDSGVPGPKYDIDRSCAAVQSRAPAYTLGGPAGERVSYPADNVPGPGTYNLDRGCATVQPSAPAYTLGAAYDSSLLDGTDSPGPAAYNPRIGASVAVAPAFSMGPPSQPSAVPLSTTPGPGAYNPPIPGSTTASYSIAGKYASRPADDMPGPGEYIVARGFEATKHSSPRYSVQGKATNSFGADQPGASMPGPGTYDQRADGPHASSAPSFSIAARPAPVLSSEGAPGPGTYSVNPDKDTARATYKGPKYTMAARWGSGGSPTRPEPGSTAPGPGAYTLDERHLNFKQMRAPAFSMGGAVGRPSAQAVKAQGPGPGSYYRPGATGQSSVRAPAYSMGAPSARVRGAFSGESTPGPGAYTHQAQGLRVKYCSPSFSMGGRPPDMRTAPRRRFGRKHGQSEVSPGPGTYAPKVPWGGAAYSIQGKHSDATRAALAGGGAPGPGTYNPGLLHKHTLPKYTIQGKYKDGVLDNGMPGPGAYNLEGTIDVDAVSSPRYTIQGKYKDGVLDNGMPGPGAYNLEGTVYASRASPPAYSIQGRYN